MTRIGLVLAAMLPAVPAAAHHSFGMFDATVCKSIVGTVFKFTVTYPHTWMWLYVPGANGAVETWGFEGSDPATLRVAGWSKDELKIGSKITLVFSPLKDGRPGGRFHEATLANGHVLKLPVQGLPCPADIQPVNPKAG